MVIGALVALCAVIVVIALLVVVPGGKVGAPKIQPATSAPGSPQEPPPPPPGALLLTREDGIYGVGIELQPHALTAIVLSPHGGGASGLRVSFRLTPGGAARTTACGNGCYRAPLARAPRSVRLLVAGQPPVDFAIPASTKPGAALVDRAARAMTSLRTLVFRERLASTPTDAIHTLWKLEAPNRLSYTIDTGVAGVVVGPRRWDKSSPKQKWVESPQFPLHVMNPVWGTEAVDARIVDTGTVAGRRATRVTFANPSIPAFFDTWVDDATGRTLRLDMIAAAHFMHHDYLRFNAPLKIRPPA